MHIMIKKIHITINLGTAKQASTAKGIAGLGKDVLHSQENHQEDS